MPAIESSSSALAFQYDARRAQLQPREYQTELVRALRDRVNGPMDPGTRLLVEVATGGGKSLIANEFTWAQVERGKRVLCVTMNWMLLAQTARDLCGRHQGAAELASYVGGGAGGRAMDGLRNSADGQIVYTTIHSWMARKDKDFADQTFDYVVVDEVHWGEGAPLYEALHKRYGGHATFVGLTATPRRWSHFERVGRAYDLPALVQLGFLAEPRLHAVQTGITWRPHLAGTHGDVTPTSMRPLATSDERNRLVVSTYVENAPEYLKTIVFACNIAHAKVLAGMFIAAGVAADATHSKMSDADRERVVGEFRAGTLDVLVNVAAAVHGLDVPDIQTVMLARPTASDILMQQMLGRGARLAPGKKHFWIVDFVDNVAAHGAPVLRPDGFIGSRLRQGARGPRLPRHTYEPAALEPFPRVEGYAELEGLLVQPGQTFGIEFELTRPDFWEGGARWTATAEKVLEALKAADLPVSARISPGHGPGKDNTVWNVERDASCGWEITSRILRGFEGFVEIADACRVIQDVAAREGLDVTVRTGTHVHLGWGDSAASLMRLFEIAAYFEPALLSLVAPSRATSTYARSVRRTLKAVRTFTTAAEWRDFLQPYERRYLAVNPRGLFHGYGTVEVRMHSGTIEAPKILTWVSLWMAALAAAEQGRPLPGDPSRRLYRSPLCPGVRGDVVELADYLGAGHALTDKLVARRDQVVTNSWMRNELYGKLAGRLYPQWQHRLAERQARQATAAE